MTTPSCRRSSSLERARIWAAVLTGLQTRADAAGLITWEVNVDSAICEWQ
ncbi:hypothetical protein [Streptomyces sp. NPDC051677]